MLIENILRLKIKTRSLLPRPLLCTWVKFRKTLKIYFNVKFLFYRIALKFSMTRLLQLFGLEKRFFVDIDIYAQSNPNKLVPIHKRVQELVFAEPSFIKNDGVAERAVLHISEKKIINDYIAKSVVIIGGSKIVLVDASNVLYEMKYMDPDTKFRYTDSGMLFYGADACILKADKCVNKIKTGIKLTANYSWNYYHFMYEVIVAFYVIEMLKIDPNIPLIVDEICLAVPQYRELITIFNYDNRKIITVKKCNYVYVEELYFISYVNKVVPNYVSYKNMSPQDNLFDKNALRFIRSTVLNKKVQCTSTKRIYLSRRNASNWRRFNEGDVVEVVKKHGFTIISPEEYSVLEQAAIFNNAEYIIGASGAAFTNLLFCNSSCKVICITNSKVPFSYFPTIASFAGAKFSYYCNQNFVMDASYDEHNHFVVDISAFETIVHNLVS